MYLHIQDNGMDGRVQQVFAVMTQLATIQVVALRMGDNQAIAALNDTIKRESNKITPLQHQKDLLLASGRVKEAARINVPDPEHMLVIQRMLQGEPVFVTLSYDGLIYRCCFDQIKRRLGKTKPILRGQEVIEGPEEAMVRHARFITEVRKLFEAPIMVSDVAESHV